MDEPNISPFPFLDPFLRRLARVWRLPIWSLATILVVVTGVLGGLLLVEPASWLRARRGDGKWKVLPMLKNVQGIRDSVDVLQAIVFRSDKSRTIINIMRLMLTPVTLPIRLGLALCDVTVVRSMVVLTVLPFTALTIISWLMVNVMRVVPTLDAGAAQHSGKSWSKTLDLKTLFVTLGAPTTAWCLTALTLFSLFWINSIRRTLLRWFVSDAPLGMYIIILALILGFAAVATNLSRSEMAAALTASGSSPRQAASALIEFQRNLTGSALAAAVASMWIIRLMNPRLFSYRRCVGDV